MESAGVLSSVFMEPDTERHLSIVLQPMSGSRSSSELLQYLMRCLAKPPMLTTLRINTLKYDRDAVIKLLSDTLSMQYSSKSLPPPPVVPHPHLSDVIVVPNYGPRSDILPQKKKVIVDLRCGIAVLRGADVFAPGVIGAPKDLCRDDYVSVYADIDGKCKRGLTVEYRNHTQYVGNGYAQLSRHELFSAAAVTSGLAIRMTDALYTAPSLNSELTDAIFLQNLPSIAASHVLNPQPGEVVLDMCAAPGGKTVHIGMLMKDKGCVIALDKTATKVIKLQQNVKRFGLSCIQCYTFDATHALSHSGCKSEMNVTGAVGGLGPPPYFGETFDKVLLDAPCSALGQRPYPVCHLKLKELLSYPHYQKKLITQAVGLLKQGGILVYCTCTYTPEENECQVEWILKTFSQLKLIEQDPLVGYPGFKGYGLNEEQQTKVQRFGPAEFYAWSSSKDNLKLTTDYSVPHKNVFQCVPVNIDSLNDMIGFFIAKFIKS